MKQKTTKTETCSLSARRNFRTDDDTNTLKKFEATLTHIQHSWAKVVIEAGSLAEAEQKAHEINPEEIQDWNSCECSFDVHTVEPIEGGQDHE